MQPGQLLTAYIDEICKNGKIINNIHPNDKPAMGNFIRKVRGQGVIFAVDLENTEIPVEKFKQYDANIFRPPYPVTVLEYSVHSDEDLGGDKVHAPHRVIVAMDEGDHVRLFSFFYADTIRRWRDPTFQVILPYNQTGTMAYEIHPFLVEQFNANYTRYIRDMGYTVEQFNDMVSGDIFDEICGYAVFCTVLNENHVEFTDIEPHKGRNKMRRALGKAPLFTYKVLTIGKPKRKSAHQGGTHASPRSHLRRGYYRTSKTGKRHWVQPCMVKGETPGFVHKDYKVEGDAA